MDVQKTPVPGLVFHHVGVACTDFAAEELVYTALGYQREGENFTDPIQGIQGCFLVGGGPRLELLRDIEERETIAPWLRKGIKLYHLAYEAADMNDASTRLRAMGAKVVVAPMPAAAFGGRKIAFFMLPNRAMVELISDR